VLTHTPGRAFSSYRAMPASEREYARPPLFRLPLASKNDPPLAHTVLGAATESTPRSRTSFRLTATPLSGSLRQRCSCRSRGNPVWAVLGPSTKRPCLSATQPVSARLWRKIHASFRPHQRPEATSAPLVGRQPFDSLRLLLTRQPRAFSISLAGHRIR